jgi:UPF0755 protein
MESVKFLLGLFIYALTIAVVLSVGSFWWLSREYVRPGPLKTEILFEVRRGDSLSSIAAKLGREGALAHPKVFAIAGRILNQQANLKAGEYRFTPGMSAGQILTMLKEGKTFARRFTLREGLTSYEIVEILKNFPELQGDIAGIPAEGTLLPQTYDYTRGEQRQAVIERLRHAMRDTLEDLWPGRAENLPFSTKEEALSLASIVEKETGVTQERKRVAGVFINRLRHGIPLQSDPTVIYALTKGRHENAGRGPLGRRLLTKDLETVSPYNTYLNSGLPPGPIANPGRDSIEAVLHPEDHDYLYFVADGSGGHVFAATLAEHVQNVDKWRKIRREKSR